MGGLSDNDVDADGDGYTAEVDCDDSGSAVNPGANEEATGEADNTSYYNGGGVYLHLSSPEFSGNVVSNNTSYEDGARLYTNRSAAWVHDNEFVENKANDDAGGLRVFVGRNMVIEDNIFLRNTAGDDAGGLKLSHSENIIRRNLFAENSAGDAGGGLELDNETSDVLNCEFRDNRAVRGGGLYSWRNEGPLRIEDSLSPGYHVSSCGGAIQMDNNPFVVLLYRLDLFWDQPNRMDVVYDARDDD